ncbi:TetR/AcrR family transcriptional regulator [Qipengyuania vesicularis]|uniref:TetR/AcrR family transcriptional regulator n=1 Tax=Qipengyuania vesicularis TaxID=2867232 RepID=UPI001C8735AD|nr:TetR/AcrR family transcriptional regulator [Qipengyuania vesicularis]MBX7528008.1 TetR/AcrR family transcriptional regulator [Qipengyuania vesicularis]
MNAPQSELTRAEATRLRILDAAAGLFWRRSFHGVSIDEIAARSEVNKATIYRYYLDKSELALAAIAHNGDTVLQGIFAPVFEHYSSAEDRLERVFLCLYEAHRAFDEREGDLFGCPIAGLALELGQDMPDLRAEAQKIFDKVEAHMLEIAICAPQPRASARETARMLVQLLHGAFTSARLSVDPLRVVDAGNAALILLGSERRIAIPEDRRIS